MDDLSQNCKSGIEPTYGGGLGCTGARKPVCEQGLSRETQLQAMSFQTFLRGMMLPGGKVTLEHQF